MSDGELVYTQNVDGLYVGIHQYRNTYEARVWKRSEPVQGFDLVGSYNFVRPNDHPFERMARIAAGVYPDESFDYRSGQSYD